MHCTSDTLPVPLWDAAQSHGYNKGFLQRCCTAPLSDALCLLGDGLSASGGIWVEGGFIPEKERVFAQILWPPLRASLAEIAQCLWYASHPWLLALCLPCGLSDKLGLQGPGAERPSSRWACVAGNPAQPPVPVWKGATQDFYQIEERTTTQKQRAQSWRKGGVDGYLSWTATRNGLKNSPESKEKSSLYFFFSTSPSLLGGIEWGCLLWWGRW